MIDLNKEKCGVISGALNSEEIKEVIDLMAKLKNFDSKHETAQYFRPIGIGDPLYSWFKKKIFEKAKSSFQNNQNIEMLFASYTDEKRPFGIHSDYYHKRDKKPCVAMLIPISVDYSEDGIDRCSTIVFNEKDNSFEPNIKAEEKTYKNNWREFNNIEKDNNASSLHQKYLSHCDIDDLKYLTIQRILHWKTGDILWWDEEYLHTTNNFKKENIESKQFFIIHTFLNEKR